MALKIYTKTGDNGSTSLIGGTKIPKSHIRIESYGTVDELNAHIGLVSDLFDHEHSRNILKEIQDRLFVIGASLACDPEKEAKLKIPDLNEEDILLLEKEIDVMHEELSPLKHFILPGGHPTVSTTHIARCVCRRAERICVSMQEEGLSIDGIVIKYLNRLSDYLFALSRYMAHTLKVKEVTWVPRNQ